MMAVHVYHNDRPNDNSTAESAVTQQYLICGDSLLEIFCKFGCLNPKIHRLDVVLEPGMVALDVVPVNLLSYGEKKMNV